MKKIHKYIVILGLCAGMCLSSCELSNTNIDPGRPLRVTLSTILPGLEAQAAYNVGALAGRLSGIVMQHFAGNDAQQLAYTNYNITESDVFNLWNTGLYAGSFKDCVIIIEEAEATGNFYYAGIAKVLLAHGLGLATSFWGDIPYSEAFKPDEFPKPSFDTQEQIYQSIQSLLDGAISDFSQPAYPAPAPPGNIDLIFRGNAAKWLATARSLKARFFMHLTRKGTATAAQQALAQITAGAITGNADDPVFPFSTAQPNANPYFLFGIQRPGTMIIAPSFADRLTTLNDPRKNKFVHTNNTSYYNSANTNLFWVQANSPLPLISYTEVKFIEAEALLLTGDVSGAETALAAAIQSNMTRVGVAEADATTYIAARGNFTGLTTDEERLERIIDEKYVALYAQAPTEVWVDYRRTGFPALTPIPNGEAAGLNPGGQIPRRFIYPITERQTNRENLDAAKQRQGGDLMNVNLWAFVP